jgi:hypothetical protein
VTEFLKGKIGFAVSLLAVLFTTADLIPAPDFLDVSLFGWSFGLAELYAVVASALGLSVYSYAVAYIGSDFRYAEHSERLGNVLYGLAIASPIVFASLLLVSVVSSLVDVIPAQALNVGLGVAAGFGTSLLTDRIRSLLARKDEQSRADLGSDRSAGSIERAARLLDEEHFDLAVVEAFRGLEVAARANVRTRAGAHWMSIVAEPLPGELRHALNELRSLRNRAVHGAEPISREDAALAVQTVGRVLAILDDKRRPRCTRCDSEELKYETGVDHGHEYETWVCESCGARDPYLPE